MKQQQPVINRTIKSASPTMTRPWLVLFSVLCGFFLSIVDATIVNISLVSIRQHFHTDIALSSWILDGYNVTVAVLLVAAGRLADQFGRKKVFQLGVILFGIGSVLCGFSVSVQFLIGARVVQAIGAAALPTVSLALVSSVFPGPKERGVALSIWGALSGLAAAAGPVLGGFLVQYGWQWIFFVNVPVCLVGIVLVAIFVPESRPDNDHTPLDMFGLLLLSLAVFGVVLGVIEGNHWGWLTPAMFLLVAGTCLALILFLLRQKTFAHPIIPLNLFQQRSFTSASLAMLFFCIALQAAYLILPYYFILARGESQLSASFAIVPIPLTSFLVSVLSGKLVRVSQLAKAMSGLVCVAGGLVTLSSLPSTSTMLDVAWRGAIIGTGTGLCFSVLPALAMSHVPAQQFGIASGVFNCFRQVGFALGVAFLLSVLDSQLQPAHTPAFSFLHAFSITWLLAACSAVCGMVCLAWARRTLMLPFPSAFLRDRYNKNSVFLQGRLHTVSMQTVTLFSSSAHQRQKEQPSTRGKQRIRFGGVFIVLLAIGVLAGSVLSYARVPSKHTILVQTVQHRSGEATFSSSPHGFNDEMKIILPSLPPLASGMTYNAWLITDQKQSDAEWLSLGTLTKDTTGSMQLLYPGDASHTDLLETHSALCVTTSAVNLLQPLRSDCRYYGEITQTPNANDRPDHYSMLDHVRHLLASDPTLEALHIHNGLMANFDAQVSKIAEWASATATETSMSMVHKHMVRILDALDGFCLVHNDVPAGTPLLVDTTSTSVGVVRGSMQAPSYVGHIEKHMNGMLNSPGVSSSDETLARQMYRAMQIITSELSQVYVDAKQLVMMNDAQLMQSEPLLEDLRSNASNAYSGGYPTALSQTRVDGTKDLVVEFQKFGIIDIYRA